MTTSPKPSSNNPVARGTKKRSGLTHRDVMTRKLLPREEKAMCHFCKVIFVWTRTSFKTHAPRVCAEHKRPVRVKVPKKPKEPEKPECPTPQKLRYSQNKAFHTALRRSGKIGKPLRTYLCPCGSYHLTSKK